MDKNTFFIFNDILYHLYSCHNQDDLKNLFLKRLKLLIPFSYASILLSEAFNNNIPLYQSEPICFPDSFAETEKEYLAHADEDDLFWLVNGKESTLVRESDLMGDDRRLTTSLYKKCYQKYNIYDTLQFSIIFQQNFLGILTLFRTKIDGTFSDEDMFYLRSLGTHLNTVVNSVCEFQHNKLQSDAETIKILKEKYHLTAKESEILSLLFAFCSNDEIAAKMEISENTIQKHLQNLFRKLNVSSKWELLKFKTFYTQSLP